MGFYSDWPMYPPNFKSVALPVPEVKWVAKLQTPISRKGGHRGSGMVRFERALVGFYRPSILTFRLSLRVSETLSLLCSSVPLFPYPTSSLPKFVHVPLKLGGSHFGYKERRCWAIIHCVPKKRKPPPNFWQ